MTNVIELYCVESCSSVDFKSAREKPCERERERDSNLHRNFVNFPGSPLFPRRPGTGRLFQDTLCSDSSFFWFVGCPSILLSAKSPTTVSFLFLDVFAPLLIYLVLYFPPYLCFWVYLLSYSFRPFISFLFINNIISVHFHMVSGCLRHVAPSIISIPSFIIILFFSVRLSLLSRRYTLLLLPLSLSFIYLFTTSILSVLLSPHFFFFVRLSRVPTTGDKKSW